MRKLPKVMVALFALAFSAVTPLGAAGSTPLAEVDLSVIPDSAEVPGGDFTFNLVVNNTGTVPFAITSIADDVYGNLARDPKPSDCDAVIGDVLDPEGSATCSFVGSFTNSIPSSQTNVVTVVVTTADGVVATGSDDATVTLTMPPCCPLVDVEMVASPLLLQTPGGDFTFTVVVTNTGGMPLTINSLTDDIYGDLAARPPPNSCAALIGTTLEDNGSSATCEFTGSFTAPINATQTNVVTVEAMDRYGRTTGDSDSAEVELLHGDGPSVVRVEMDVSPAGRPEPGGIFTFTVVVGNPGSFPVEIVSLVDNVHGDLATAPGPNTCDELIGQTVGVLNPRTCTLTTLFTGAAWETATNTLTVRAAGGFGPATDSDDATITLTPRPECTITGTEGNDDLAGTGGPDVICGKGGNDKLSGNGGEDILLGGPGGDRLDGGGGDDVLLGGAGDDRLSGGPGMDLLVGGRGNDVVSGDEGGDYLYGRRGNDRLTGGPGTDAADGGLGRDRCAAETEVRC